ncbi:MAG: hypothetical protein KTR16_04595 [Acidiferrobacterales bacterium]|nr:hypothetical protein [Acidiferrobacterales bacterium]
MKRNNFILSTLFLLLCACVSGPISSPISENDKSTDDEANLLATKIEQARQADLDICDKDTAQFASPMREQIKEVCECSVNKSDYAKILEFRVAGDEAAIRKMKTEFAQQCAAL